MKPLTTTQQQLVTDHMRTARIIASKRFRQMPNAMRQHIIFDDLVSVADIALCEAAARFKDNHGCKFSTFAGKRVHGAITDHLRESDPLSRHDRAKVRRGEAQDVTICREEAAYAICTPSHAAQVEAKIDAERLSAQFPWMALHYLFDNPQVELARAVGFDASRVSQHIAAETAKARKALKCEA